MVAALDFAGKRGYILVDESVAVFSCACERRNTVFLLFAFTHGGTAAQNQVTGNMVVVVGR